MDKRAIRDRFLRDHGELRGKAVVLESLALQVLRGDEELISALRLKGQDLQAHLLRHMEWEEAHISPVLESRNGAARFSSAALEKEHGLQRERIARLIEKLHDTQNGIDLARSLLDFTGTLESDMAAEEAHLLGGGGLG
jgi:hemerythrin-like domain-containing protein